MTDSGLTLGQFEELLHTFGADFSRWPNDRIIPARRLIEHSDEARRMLAESESVDRLFDANKDLTAPDDLLGRIMNATEKK